MTTFLTRRLERLRRRDDGYAMMMTLLLMLIISVTMLAVAGVYLSQLTPTRLDKKRVQTIDAAAIAGTALRAVLFSLLALWLVRQVSMRHRDGSASRRPDR